MQRAMPGGAMFALTAALLATGGGALGDDVKTDARSVRPVQGAAPANSRAAGPTDTVREYKHVRASRLIGMYVRNPANEKMGQIKDLIVDLDGARVHYAVLELDGQIFVSKKLFVYPLTAFKPAADGEHMVLAVEKGKLAAAPGFSSDQWPNWHARSKEIDQYFGIVSPSDPGAGARRLVRASSYLRADVRDPQGKDVGDLTELVVDMSSGAVPYAVVAFDKPWSIDDRLVAVPLKAFAVDDKGHLHVNVTREAIASAPSISRRDWPKANLSQNAWVGKVDRYALSLTVPTTAVEPASRSEARGAPKP